MRNISAHSAIRMHCLDCMAGDRAEVVDCNIVSCSLHAFRLQKRVASEVGQVEIRPGEWKTTLRPVDPNAPKKPQPHHLKKKLAEFS